MVYTMSVMWTTGINIEKDVMGWLAGCHWISGNSVENNYMEGEINTRYYLNSLSQAIDAVLSAMSAMNVKRSDEAISLKFGLYLDGRVAEEDMADIAIEVKNRGWDLYLTYQD